jgi:hypothetical protein
MKPCPFVIPAQKDVFQFPKPNDASAVWLQQPNQLARITAENRGEWRNISRAEQP